MACTGDANGLVFDSLVATQVVALPNAYGCSSPEACLTPPMRLPQEGEVFARVTSKSDRPLAFGFPRSFNRSPLWNERTYFPAWQNTSTNTNIPKGHVLPVPKPGQRVDKEGW